MGSFADAKDNPNCFTLVSVNDFSFAKTETKPDPEKPNPEKPNKKKGCGAVALTGVVSVITVVAAAAVVLKKRD